MSGIFDSSGSLNLFAASVLARRHVSPNALGLGNGYLVCVVVLATYFLSRSAVLVFSLKIPLLCPFVPVRLIIPCSRSICSFGVCLSSSPSAAVSAIIVKIVEYLLEEAEIIFVTCSVVGIICFGFSARIFGLSYGIWFAVQNIA